MARNGSGTHSVSLTFTPSTPALASDVNAVLQDIADEITNSLALDGQSTMTGQLKAADGSAALPSLSFGSDTNSGFYRKSSDTVAVAIGGADIASFTSSGVSLAAGKTVSFPTTGGGLIPTGGIIMWSGTIATIPTGWLLCNGSNGTPDLRNRFVIGAHSDSSGAKTTITGSATQTGGSKDAIAVAHTHTGTTSSDGEHTHPFNYEGAANIAGSGGQIVAEYPAAQDGTTGSGGAHTHSFTTDSAGSSGTDANLPPYYALAYIMKA